jgi:hypothetical protein
MQAVNAIFFEPFTEGEISSNPAARLKLYPKHYAVYLQKAWLAGDQNSLNRPAR